MDEIVKAEQQIRTLKKELVARTKAPPESSPNKRSTYLANRIDRLRQLNFVWRSFGDAVAFLYMDRFALKHTYYSTANTNPKQPPGFLLGKEGLEAEWAVMEQALEAGIPSLLVDLTNTIRHGDVCFMVGPDPRLVEVKAGRKLDRRGRKQAQHIKQLHQFFETDQAVGLRGMAEVRRVAFQAPEQSYSSELNACIDAAMKKGCSIVNPERGLYYVALTDAGPPTQKVFEQIRAKRPWVFPLNEFKSNRAWAPYLPFLLSIRSEAHLYAFLQGTLYLLVVVDIDALSDVVGHKGFTAEFDLANEDHPLKLTKRSLAEPASISISSHIMKRIGLEFASPEWIVNAALESFERNRSKFAEAATN